MELRVVRVSQKFVHVSLQDLVMLNKSILYDCTDLTYGFYGTGCSIDVKQPAICEAKI